MRVYAEVMSDDMQRLHKFDCFYYLDDADDEELVALVESNCGGDIEAGQIAVHMKDYDEGVEGVLGYCRKEKFGFVVSVDQDGLFEYLGAYRPEVAELLTQIGYS